MIDLYKNMILIIYYNLVWHILHIHVRLYHKQYIQLLIVLINVILIVLIIIMVIVKDVNLDIHQKY